ncbi:MAG: flagellar export chaperone FliS [Treponemataceae bacterium]|nr:flagellar export chaperone FliS [Treponemataceae bacterium]
MAYQNPYAAYKETGVKTASGGKLIVMLYEEAVRQLELAESLFTDGEKLAPAGIEKLNKCIVKTQEIITELEVSLDMDKGGEIAQNLLSLYTFFNQELMQANISHDKTKLGSVRKMLSDLLGAWRTAAETTSASGQQRQNIDISL